MPRILSGYRTPPDMKRRSSQIISPFLASITNNNIESWETDCSPMIPPVTLPLTVAFPTPMLTGSLNPPASTIAIISQLIRFPIGIASGITNDTSRRFSGRLIREE